MTKIVFIDTETTGVHPARLAWEIAMIERSDSGEEREMSFFVDIDLSAADPFGLKVGRFYERHPRGRMLSDDPSFKGGVSMSNESAAAERVARWTHGAILVGAVPNFDTETLAPLLRRNGLLPAWHYHLVDVETLAAGALKMAPPWDFDSVLAAYGLSYDEADRHTALGDARMARDLYDAILRA